MKTFILDLIICSILLSAEAYAQNEPIQQAEVIVWNYTNHPVFIKVYPVGAIFSGSYTPATQYCQKYSLHRSNDNGTNPRPYWPNRDFITGGAKTVQSNDYCVIDFDDGMYYDIDSLRGC